MQAKTTTEEIDFRLANDHNLKLLKDAAFARIQNPAILGDKNELVLKFYDLHIAIRFLDEFYSKYNGLKLSFTLRIDIQNIREYACPVRIPPERLYYINLEALERVILNILSFMPTQNADFLEFVLPVFPMWDKDRWDKVRNAVTQRKEDATHQAQQYVYTSSEINKKLPQVLLDIICTYITVPTVLLSYQNRQMAIEGFQKYLAKKWGITQAQKTKKQSAEKCIAFLSWEYPYFFQDEKNALKSNKLKKCFDEQAEKCPELKEAPEGKKFK